MEKSVYCINSRIGIIRFGVFIFTSVCFFSGTAVAVEPASPLDIEQNREKQRQVEQETKRILDARPSKQKEKAEITTPTLLPEGECQTINKIFLYGADQVGDSEQTTLFKEFIGQCLDNEGIAKVARVLQQRYLEGGFITSRVSIKKTQSSLDKGNLELWVLEGYIGEFILGSNTSFDQSRISAAFPVASGDILNIKDLDQGIEQLNRLFSQNFRMQIKPADKSGYSNIILIEILNTEKDSSRHQDKHQFSYSYSNSGSKETGKDLHNLSLTRENLFGFNDVLLFSWQRGTPYESNQKENETLRFSASMPAGYYYYRLNYTDANTVRQVTGNTTFLSKSNINTTQLSINRMISRSQQYKTEVTSNIEYSDRKNFINETLVQTSSRRIASIDLGLNYTHYFNASTLIVTPSIAQGVPWFGAIEDSSTIQENDPHAEYTLFKFYLYFRTRLTDSDLPISFQTSLNIQESSEALYGEKQIVLGGEYSIRGYKENVLSSNSGWTLRNDLIFPVAKISETFKNIKWISPLNAKLFYDTGHGASTAGSASESLSGWGVGLDYQYNGFNFSISHAKALDTSSQFLGEEGWVTYINAGARFTF